jgi:Flp pilus assembly pilin Flp
MTDLAFKFWTDDTGQDIAEYAVMLAVILVLVVGTLPARFSRRSPLEHFWRPQRRRGI